MLVSRHVFLIISNYLWLLTIIGNYSQLLIIIIDNIDN